MTEEIKKEDYPLMCDDEIKKHLVHAYFNYRNLATATADEEKIRSTRNCDMALATADCAMARYEDDEIKASVFGQRIQECEDAIDESNARLYAITEHRDAASHVLEDLLIEAKERKKPADDS